MSSSVFPEPAGAWTMNDAAVSRARSRAALSAIIFQLPNAAQRLQSAVFASVTLGIDLGMSGTKIVRQFFKYSLPLRFLFAEGPRYAHGHFFQTGRSDTRVGQALQLKLTNTYQNKSGSCDGLIAGGAIQRELRLIRSIAIPDT